MDVAALASLVDRTRALPPDSAGRARRLQHLTDLSAAAEAAAALRAAARLAGEGGAVAAVLSAAVALNDSDTTETPFDDAAARDRLTAAVSAPAFLALVPSWTRELRTLASERPDTGACTLGTAIQLWSWTVEHFRAGNGAHGDSARQAIDELAGALRPWLAARCLALEVAGRTPPSTRLDPGLRSNLCHVYAAHAAASLGAVCAELVFGYRRHLAWDAEGCAACYGSDELDELEGLMPGIASSARVTGDVIEADGSHPFKAGPCPRAEGVETFVRLRARLDGCLTGARLAKDRAAAALGGR